MIKTHTYITDAFSLSLSLSVCDLVDSHSTSSKSEMSSAPPSSSSSRKKRKAPVLTWMRSSVALKPPRSASPVSPDTLPQLHKQLAHVLSGKLNVKTIFPVQRAVWLATLGGLAARHDVCVCAPTGSGKTLAYLLPTVNAIAGIRGRFSSRTCSCLVVLPTRELAAQVHAVAAQLCAAVSLDTANLAGEEDANYAADVVMSTPGRLAASLSSPSGKNMLAYVRFLVIDEVDRLLRQSYQGWLQLVLDAIHSDDHGTRHGIAVQRRAVRDAAPRCVKLVLSATLTRDPVKIARLRLTDPVYIEDDDGVGVTTATMNADNDEDGVEVIDDEDMDKQQQRLDADAQHAEKEEEEEEGGRESDVDEREENAEERGRDEEEEEEDKVDDDGHRLPPGLVQYKLIARTGEKPLALLTLLAMMNNEKGSSASPLSVIVFTGSLEASHRLAALLAALHASSGGDALLSSPAFSTVQFSSSMTHAQRADALDGFRRGSYRVMIASDAATRGIDIPNVDLVVNYDAPVFARYDSHTHTHACMCFLQNSVLVQERERERERERDHSLTR